MNFKKRMNIIKISSDLWIPKIQGLSFGNILKVVSILLER